MMPAADLPDDPETLKAMLLAAQGEIAHLKAVNADAETRMERLTSLLKTLERARYGRRSETLDPEQHAFVFEDIETGVAAIEARLTAPGLERARAGLAAVRLYKTQVDQAHLVSGHLERAAPEVGRRTRLHCNNGRGQARDEIHRLGSSDLLRDQLATIGDTVYMKLLLRQIGRQHLHHPSSCSIQTSIVADKR